MHKGCTIEELHGHNKQGYPLFDDTNSPTPPQGELEAQATELVFNHYSESGKFNGTEAVKAIVSLITAQVQEAEARGRRDELEWVLTQQGNSFVGNGENMIIWNARNRLAALQDTTGEGE